jgi:hypothetical protein
MVSGVFATRATKLGVPVEYIDPRYTMHLKYGKMMMKIPTSYLLIPLLSARSGRLYPGIAATLFQPARPVLLLLKTDRTWYPARATACCFVIILFLFIITDVSGNLRKPRIEGNPTLRCKMFIASL